MAKLKSLVDEVEMVVRPDRITERGAPTWVLTELKLLRGGRPLLSTTVTVTVDDLEELREGVGNVLSGHQSSFRISGTDEDFALDAETFDLVDRFFVSVWAGEPNSLMLGYRFLVERDSLSQFLSDLANEQASLLSGGRSSIR